MKDGKICDPAVVCPLYCYEAPPEIVCEGIVQEGRERSYFPRRESFMQHKKDFCTSMCYEGCPIYQMVTQCRF